MRALRPGREDGDGRRIAVRPGIGAALRVVQARGLLLSGVFVERPGLTFVRRGEKRVRVGGFDRWIDAGEALALPAGLSLEVVNHADADGLYEAVSLIPDQAVMDRMPVGETPGPIREPVHLRRLGPAFGEALGRALEAILTPGDVPDAVAAARVQEVVGWLGARGVAFARTRPTSAGARVRELLGGRPEHRWSGPEVAAALGMSEATLRRRLAAEGMSLSALLVEVRMSTALVLLQATDRPVTEIALAVGYESPSRFAARFRRRFGHPPAAIRHGDPDFDRRGIENDRHGSAARAAR